MKRFLKNQRGVTMMEVLVTVGLLAIVVVPCLSSFVMAQKGNALAKQTYQEYTDAVNLMEELKADAAQDGILDVEERVQELNGAYDRITATAEQNGTYYVITVYLGELSEQEIEQQTEYILKGVVVP